MPIIINRKKYYLTFYEVERNTQTVNLIPMFIDGALQNSGYSPSLENFHYSRTGAWYIALTVTNEDFNDNLKEKDPAYNEIIKHLDNLRNEYLTTANYMEVYLKSK